MAVSGLALASLATQSSAVTAAADTPPSANCQLRNGVQHVIEITFDNVHFNRDNPNVPSDLEQIPALKNFIEGNGTLLSNNHTPLIAHTADDIITNLTGLYGDRHGVGITNNYDVYNPGGATVTNKSAFAYWTANYGIAGDPYPNLAYSPTVPAAGSPPAVPPAPWVPYTRAGCDFGGVSTANLELENTNPDLQNVFGAGSPEVNQYKADLDPFKDDETNDYVGLAVHCAQGDTFCSGAQAVKYGTNGLSNTQAPDPLPDEPGGYVNYDAVFGSRYLSPELAKVAGAGGVRTVNGDNYTVADGQGNLTDLNGAIINGAFKTVPVGQVACTAANTPPGCTAPTFMPGFPGFSFITAAQSLAYVADMQEAGVPVTYAYISDLHQRFPGQKGCTSPDGALGPGDPCYEASAAAYNAAFTTFFQRLADDGITPANTEFVFAADEGDHFAGANVGRAVTPACSGTPGVAVDTAAPAQTPYLCSYAAGQLGEVSTDIHSLLQYETGDPASFGFYSQPQGESLYVLGGADTATVRQLERDVGGLTMVDPYDGPNPEPVAKWMVDPTAEQLLHFVNADPNRTPSFTVWPNPDVFFTGGTGDSCPAGTNAGNAATNCNPLNSGFSWNHGYYAPEVDNTWLGLVGPGVAHRGLDGHDAADGPNSAGNAANGATTVPQVSLEGTWSDHTDIRSTLLALVGLQDDYVGDGRVLTEDLTIRPGATGSPLFEAEAVCYKQLNSSVGTFGTDVIQADTAALKTGSAAAGDQPYQTFLTQLRVLGSARDKLAGQMKQELWDAEFNGTPLGDAGLLHTFECGALLGVAGVGANT
jgi:hypothetical protein